jgi:transposase-like protein
MRVDNSPSLRAAQNRRHALLTQRALDAAHLLARSDGDVNFSAVARHSGVSRSFLYRSAELANIIGQQRKNSPNTVPIRQRMTDNSKQAQVEQLRADNTRLRAELAESKRHNAVLFGELRRARRIP